MVVRPALWEYSADQAAEAARLVVQHDPDQPRSHRLIPIDAAAAAASVAELAAQFHQGVLPVVRSALRHAESSAADLSDDRLQGLAELMQNADDLGARTAVFALDDRGSRLTFRHDGAGLTLHDILGLAIPWLSLKASDPSLWGRLGIGLKTLQSLSDVLEVHQGHFHVRFQTQDISVVGPPAELPQEQSSEETIFVVPLERNPITEQDIIEWLERWGEGGLVFLRHLRQVSLASGGEVLAQLRVSRGRPKEVGHADRAASRQVVRATGGRSWVVYTRSVSAPAGLRRAGKAQGDRTVVGIAVPHAPEGSGYLHIGLPVRPIGLPFRLLAEFDPLANRRDIADREWNQALVHPLSELWRDAALDRFAEDPASAWSIVPLTSEFHADERTTGRLRSEFESRLMMDARLALAAELRLPDGGDLYNISELSYEAVPLSTVLSRQDIQQVGRTPGTIRLEVRSQDDRWRRVLADLRNAGAAVPLEIDVGDALVLLEEERPVPFLADLLGVAVAAGAAARLAASKCLILENGERITPQEAAGLKVLLPDDAAELWRALGMGSRLHKTYLERSAWATVGDWLRKERLLLDDASDRSAIEVLADAGEGGDGLKDPLTLTQVEDLRTALGRLPDVDRARFGVGIGKAILLDAFSFSAEGKAVPCHARPADAYFVEREANTWWIAASKTKGLIWLQRRYSETMRVGNRASDLGAQRLFRLLGAETAPRVMLHPENQSIYKRDDPAVSRYASGSPGRRNAQMDRIAATYTLLDSWAPDLDKVLRSISQERDVADRIRRSSALLHTLRRAWERLEPRSRVKAAIGNYNWNERGIVDAWWLASAASVPWLTAKSGNPKRPADLRIRTPGTVALFGDDPDDYLDDQIDASGYVEQLAALGVRGEAPPEDLLDALRDIRAKFPADRERAVDEAAPIYRALASQVRGPVTSLQLGPMGSAGVRAAFSQPPGLVATNLGWRRPSSVLSGPKIFGDYAAFIPSVTATESLWALLGIRKPTHEDAISVLRELSGGGKKRRPSTIRGNELIMLDALRILASTPLNQLPKLARGAVWVGNHWTHKRPVYAVSNPLLASGLSDQIEIWTPGGTLAQLETLIEPYGLARLDGSQAVVIDGSTASYSPELTRTFGSAVSILREDLALSDPASEQARALSWEELLRFRVCELPNLTIQLPDPARHGTLTLQVGAWLDTHGATMFVSAAEDAGSPETGAYAIASMFTTDARRIAHDWVVAWARARASYRAEEIVTAASRDADEKRARDANEDERLDEIAARPRKRPSLKAKADTAGNVPAGAGLAPLPRTRRLIDLAGLVPRNEAGERLSANPRGGEPIQGHSSKSRAANLRDPDPTRPKAPTSAGRSVPDYTAEERESVGLELAKWALGLGDERVVDIRNQHNVGADAVDDLQNFYELKVFSSGIPDTVQLENSEVERALSTRDFFLVVVGNVEEGHGPAEVRFITDPVERLRVLPSGSVRLGGLLAADALRFTFDKDEAEAPGEPR